VVTLPNFDKTIFEKGFPIFFINDTGKMKRSSIEPGWIDVRFLTEHLGDRKDLKHRLLLAYLQ
jgi:hypothetical protein